MGPKLAIKGRKLVNTHGNGWRPITTFVGDHLLVEHLAT